MPVYASRTHTMLKPMDNKVADLFISKIVPRELRQENLFDAVLFLNACEKQRDHEIICENPIFIFSAGWRSGSTLLQRLVCSDASTIIWGEPFGDRIPIPRLAATIADFNATDPTLPYAIENMSGDLSRQWIANLNPGVDALYCAHLAYFENLFGKPAKKIGFDRWGIKAVRLSAYHAMYLKWLYPKAKFLFLVRHPLFTYQSYKDRRWYSIKPAHPMNNVLKFMVHWRYIAKSFCKEFKTVDAMFLRYEDLIQKNGVAGKVACFLDLIINHDTLKQKIGSKPKAKLNWVDKIVCKLLTRDVCQVLGYDFD